MKVAILLTTCVRTKGVKEYYLRAINRWLKTSFPIFVVESSGYTFPEFEELNICSFNLENEHSSSQYEAKSILYALNFFKDQLADYTHIIKITGRYFLDLVEPFKDVDIILQSCKNDAIKWNNSEIFGFRKEHAEKILTPILEVGFMEEAIYKFAKKHKFQRLKPIENYYKSKRGGDGLVVDPL